MQNLLILYNPFYKTDVIEAHLETLKKEGKVAFGKIRPKTKDKEHKFPKSLEHIYQSTNPDNFLQLFLTDFANLFVAKVEAVQTILSQAKAPKYYKDGKYDVEAWFIITDIQEIERNDFATIRDSHLSNFITPDYGNHTFRIYGNDYDYPLRIEMKEERNYFESPQKFYHYVFKSKRFLTIKEHLINLSFGEHAYALHHLSLDNIIYAEMEYQDNKQDPLYDFSAVMVRYSKILEQEVYLLTKDIVAFLSHIDPMILELRYETMNRSYPLSGLFGKKGKPNLHAHSKILTLPEIQNLRSKLPPFVADFGLKELPQALQDFTFKRNKGVHERPISLQEASGVRIKILGVAHDKSLVKSLLKCLVQCRLELKNPVPYSQGSLRVLSTNA
ncbi:HP0729 family protein [Helicobacter bizzozeronii]|uniref:HP0729 family protein n=2 Tax=Helicobacter bizzozeronii TaxID=56877 RepID=UPI000CEEDCC6|nr:HP0729 family protein [Helicobacter bizzozeronii]